MRYISDIRMFVSTITIILSLSDGAGLYRLMSENTHLPLVGFVSINDVSTAVAVAEAEMVDVAATEEMDVFVLTVVDSIEFRKKSIVFTCPARQKYTKHL